jgi:hypothetical protein
MKYESPITCHSKDMAYVKVFADKETDRQTDRQMDRPKTTCPDLSIQGHKKEHMAVPYITSHMKS